MAIAGVEFGERAPTLALPRKRERGLTEVAARESFALASVVLDTLSTRRALPPLPLAGEGRGGGLSASANLAGSRTTTGAAS